MYVCFRYKKSVFDQIMARLLTDNKPFSAPMVIQIYEICVCYKYRWLALNQAMATLMNVDKLITAPILPQTYDMYTVCVLTIKSQHSIKEWLAQRMISFPFLKTKLIDYQITSQEQLSVKYWQIFFRIQTISLIITYIVLESNRHLTKRSVELLYVYNSLISL